jgi:hypothetical protein
MERGLGAACIGPGRSGGGGVEAVRGGMPAAAIDGERLGGCPFQGQEGAGTAWGGVGWVFRALEGRGGGAGRREGAGQSGRRGHGRMVGGCLEVEGNPDGWGPPVSESERERDKRARWGTNGPRCFVVGS